MKEASFFTALPVDSQVIGKDHSSSSKNEQRAEGDNCFLVQKGMRSITYSIWKYYWSY